MTEGDLKETMVEETEKIGLKEDARHQVKWRDSQTITSDKLFLLLAHSITFFGTLLKAFSMSSKHLYNFLSF